ncbi:metal ABC transporter substrate-binding protein [Georgenia sp. MJ206]|uniref:metal ABC transporter substrate-binding protein n=1 Tax=Georgenia wangjunii TaxID=3117730 RepID=UPI002F26D000
MPLPRPSRLGTCAATVAAVLTLTACSGTAPGSGGDGAGAAPGSGLDVMTSLYPLQYVAERVGGEHVSVSPITPPAGDAHNVELSPREVADLEAADLVVYLSDFQPAVDDAVSVTGAQALDVVAEADLHTSDELTGGDAHDDGEHGGDDAQTGGGGHADGGHADDVGHAGDGHDHGDGALDPHFWLDPARLADVTARVADELASLDPEHAEDFRTAAEGLVADLDAIGADYAAGLATCAAGTAVVTHEAYGYLLAPFGLHQEGLAGIDPESEPSPARLAEIADVVAEHDVSTIFVESALDADVAQTLADDLGITTAVLDPLERQQDEGADYLDVMRANLAALRTALECA